MTMKQLVLAVVRSSEGDNESGSDDESVEAAAAVKM